MKKAFLQIQNLQKRYAHQMTPALSGISFKIHENEKVGIVGANGSGKTTLFRLILNLIRPDQGKIQLISEDNPENRKRYLGYVSEHQQGLENFTPKELLTYAGLMAELSKEKIKERRSALLKWTNLENHQNELLAGFSKGMVQRLQLAIALFHEPKILLLDEPMSGLDPSGQEDLRSLLKELNDYTLLYSSHNLSDVEMLCERVIFFQQGKLMKDVYLSDLKENIFIVETESRVEKLLKTVKKIKITDQKTVDNILQLKISSSHAAFQDFLDVCRKNNITIHRFHSCSILEDLYDKYVKNLS